MIDVPTGFFIALLAISDTQYGGDVFRQMEFGIEIRSYCSGAREGRSGCFEGDVSFQYRDCGHRSVLTTPSLPRLMVYS